MGMRIYFSGIGGVGIGPLAEIAHDAGYEVLGSDQSASLTTRKLIDKGLDVHIGDQDGSHLRDEHESNPIDYFVYTAALSADHPELATAHELGIKCLKRDGMIARIIDQKNLKMIACAGTHGKTSTTGLLVWVMKQLGLPVSYSVGTTISFGPSGAYDPDSEYFVYECDEYDRNFLHYTPALSLISSIDYDHPDTYPTRDSYVEAFRAFIEQSDYTYIWDKDAEVIDAESIDSDIMVIDGSTALDHIKLPGLFARQNAFLVERAIRKLFPDIPYSDLIAAINSFPGTDRRLERLTDNLYSDYGHHPAEITATLSAASEMSDYIVLVYQPHQNVRQHQIRDEYTPEIFAQADEIYWLPTYQSRENPDLEILTPEELTSQLPADKVHVADLNDELWSDINRHTQEGHLVLCMGAGSIDGWLRDRLG
jgi:UDP-N-acetylmuramate--alanine ligase